MINIKPIDSSLTYSKICDYQNDLVNQVKTVNPGLSSINNHVCKVSSLHNITSHFMLNPSSGYDYTRQYQDRGSSTTPPPLLGKHGRDGRTDLDFGPVNHQINIIYLNMLVTHI